MSLSYVPLKGTPQKTYCTIDGVPYRTDENGMVFVATAHSSPLQTLHGMTTLTAAQLFALGSRYGGLATSWLGQNVPEHG